MAHAQGHLREAFVEWADSGFEAEEVGEDIFFDGQPRSVRWLIGQLWNCSDILPSTLRQDIIEVFGWGDESFRNTYAAAVQRIYRER
jgi:hypothetical protein